jgi:hypothetical protein
MQSAVRSDPTCAVLGCQARAGLVIGTRLVLPLNLGYTRVQYRVAVSRGQTTKPRAKISTVASTSRNLLMVGSPSNRRLTTPTTIRGPRCASAAHPDHVVSSGRQVSGSRMWVVNLWAQ